MDAVRLIQTQMDSSHGLLEQTMADVTPELVQWLPPGVANPIGATYAHAVLSEDRMLNDMLRGAAPLAATAYAGKTGLSEMPPRGGDGYTEWTRNVQIDLPALKEYAQAVYTGTSDYLSSLSADDLDRPVDLSNIGLGKQHVAFVLTTMIDWHIDAHCGEISCLKGLQGAKGYPF
jgi:hypothetical protein